MTTVTANHYKSITTNHHDTMYNKLFASILDSSVWLESNATRIVWFTFLAAMDEDGFARFAALENLASRARVSRSQAQEAVNVLEAPDPASSNPDNEGRRIERVPGGWIVLNAALHRDVFKREIQREQNRQRVAKHRAKKAGNGGTITCNAANENENASDSFSLRGECREGNPKRPPKPPKIGWTAADGFSQITDKDLDRWRDAYPACNISLQLRQMHEWLGANPEKAHKSNWLRFITNWLKREQDRGGDQRQDKRKAGARIPGPTETPEFEAQYKRDMEAIERAKREGHL